MRYNNTMQKRQYGFTLIELLVVIAIIGILASVVLGSLNSARAKGADASIKQSIGNMRAQAELYYDGAGNNSYNGMCESNNIQDGTGAADTTNGAGTVTCVDGDNVNNAWAIEAQLVASSSVFYCVDSNGLSIETTGSTVSATSGAEDATCGS